MGSRKRYVIERAWDFWGIGIQCICTQYDDDPTDAAPWFRRWIMRDDSVRYFDSNNSFERPAYEDTVQDM
jgi:hypothetical protein